MSGYVSFSGDDLWGITIYDFSGDSLSLKRDDYPMSFVHTYGAICDTAGNLLFYTNGMYIANAAHDTMVNGSGLNPGFWNDEWVVLPDHGYRVRDGMIILPDLKYENHYRLFHICMPEFNNGLAMQLLSSTVDMNNDNGKGAVIDKNRIVFQQLGISIIRNQFDVVRHANGRDWWIVNIAYDSRELMLHLYTPDSIYQYFTSTILPYNKSGTGECQFSPDGRLFAIAETHSKSTAVYDNSLHLYAFDRCSGAFTPLMHTISTDSSLSYNGVVFSPSGRYLFQTYQRFIFRYDTEAEDILASKDTIAEWDGYIWYPFEGSPEFRTTFGYGELAPDGNIYVTSASASPFMHKISYPDDPIKTEVIQRIPLPTINGWTVPNYPNYRLGPLEGSPCAEMFGPPAALYDYEAAALLVTFEDMTEGVPQNWHWTFGDGVNSTEQHPQHTYAVPGTYTACLSATNLFGNSTYCREVKVETTSIHTLGSRSGLKIVPNPASDQVVIELADAEGTVYLYDMVGRQAATTLMHSGTAKLSLHSLPTGIYMIKIVLEDGREVWDKVVVE